ncbi:unnamed protein product [Meloidogyne enterolobii]|uniref:Uncharacterized protein n=1 Tax=Meloidogyne enterolobii TaxID=390850 RepID=A0ACB0Z0Q2_MELEN
MLKKVFLFFSRSIYPDLLNSVSASDIRPSFSSNKCSTSSFVISFFVYIIFKISNIVSVILSFMPPISNNSFCTSLNSILFSTSFSSSCNFVILSIGILSIVILSLVFLSFFGLTVILSFVFSSVVVLSIAILSIVSLSFAILFVVILSFAILSVVSLSLISSKFFCSSVISTLFCTLFFISFSQSCIFKIICMFFNVRFFTCISSELIKFSINFLTFAVSFFSVFITFTSNERSILLNSSSFSSHFSLKWFRMLSNVFSIVLSSKINSSKFSLLILLIKSIFWNFPNFCSKSSLLK